MSDHEDKPPLESAPSWAGRWLVFIPCIGLFLAANAVPPEDAPGGVTLHDELLAFAWIALFVAMLWAASSRIRIGRRVRGGAVDSDRSRGFDVLPPR